MEAPHILYLYKISIVLYMDNANASVLQQLLLIFLNIQPLCCVNNTTLIKVICGHTVWSFPVETRVMLCPIYYNHLIPILLRLYYGRT